MQEKHTDQEDKFSKVIKIYKGKYLMNVESFIKFLKEKVQATPDTLHTIEEVILSHQNKTEQLSQQQLQNYLHLIAAAQAKTDFKRLSFEKMKTFTKLKFISSKKEGRQVKQMKSQIITEKAQINLKATSRKVIHQEKSKQTEIRMSDQQSPDEKKHKEICKQPRNTPKKVESQSQQAQQELQSTSTQNHAKQTRENSQKKQQQNKQLSVIQQTIADEYPSNITQPSLKTDIFQQFPEAQLMKLRYLSQKQVQIAGYDKFGQNFFNPIIKYKVVYKQNTVYRRYTQFQNLMKYLSKEYEGCILPQLPPKEGIKSNLSYFRGINEAFLNDRQLKLQSMLNMLLNVNVVSEDEIIKKFLTNQQFEIESPDEGNTLSYLQSITKIAFNAKELKNYGVAYYNYWTEFKQSSIKTEVTQMYKKVEPTLSQCVSIDKYRTTINNNFDRRRQIFNELDTDHEDRTLSITEFDKVSAATAAEIKNLQKEMDKYLQLISQQKWLSYLISQKEVQEQQQVEQLRREHKEVEVRVEKMQVNLLKSMDNLLRSKQLYLQEVKKLIVEWRERIHP